MALDARQIAGLGGAAAITATVATFSGALALSVSRGRKRDKAISIMGIDHAGEMKISEQAFQWWPESIADSIAIGWSDKNVMGASHAPMQWGANGGRTISFSVKLSRSMRYPEDFGRRGPALRDVPIGAGLLDPQSTRSVQYNIDIRRMLKYLRAYCYPDYNGTTGQAVPPVISIVNIPGLQLNENGQDYIFAVMTSCDHTYVKLFKDGKPRLVEVGLSFKQIVQDKDGVHYKSRNVLLDAALKGVGANAVTEPILVAHDKADLTAGLVP